MPELPQTTDEATWEAIKICSIRGVSDVELATRYGVKRVTIRQRRNRDALWKAAINSSRTPQPRNSVSHKALVETVVETVTTNLEQIGQSNATLVARFAHEATERAIQGGLIPEPSSWQELAAANKLVRVNTGMDKEGQVNVQVGIWGGQYEAFDGPTVDV